MLPSKSDSFTFRRNATTTSSSSSTTSKNSDGCRRKLNYKFENSGHEDDKENNLRVGDRSVLSVLNLNDTRKVIRSGAEKISKTFNTVRTTLGSFSQKFKMPTKRRQILEEGPMTPNPNCVTPHTFSKEVLGRTPTKLYSPFGIDNSPYNPTTVCDKENLPNLPKQRLFFRN